MTEADPRAVPRLEDLGNLDGRRVLVRTDFNIPLADGEITDDLRIRAALPTLGWLQERGANVTACTHLGRPKGVPDPRYSLAPVRARLAERAPGVELMENLRFDPGEAADDPGFVARLVDGQDAYVNEAFGASHRAHASIVGPPRFLPSAAGRLLETEVDVLLGMRLAPKRPFVAVLGGAKVSDKLGVIEALMDVVDAIVVGGGMCFTFLAAQGYDVGSSLLESDQLDTCRAFLETGKVVLPVDVVAAERFAADAAHDVVPAEAIPSDRMGLDIGPRSVEMFTEALHGAKTVFWNGPMGVFELEPYAAGTRGVAEAVASLRSRSGTALTVVGGGDSAAAVRALGIDESRFTHISTGGGASLEYLEGKALPGLTVLED